MLKHFKKQLRHTQTDAESALWYHLCDRRMGGVKFRRQHIIRGYIVDFVCLERDLVIELDGGQHTDKKLYDENRTRVLQGEGFEVIRFWNDEVFFHIDGVLEVIQRVINLYPSPAAKGAATIVSPPSMEAHPTDVLRTTKMSFLTFFPHSGDEIARG